MKLSLLFPFNRNKLTSRMLGFLFLSHPFSMANWFGLMCRCCQLMSLKSSTNGGISPLPGFYGLCFKFHLKLNCKGPHTVLREMTSDHIRWNLEQIVNTLSLYRSKVYGFSDITTEIVIFKTDYDLIIQLQPLKISKALNENLQHLI